MIKARVWPLETDGSAHAGRLLCHFLSLHFLLSVSDNTFMGLKGIPSSLNRNGHSPLVTASISFLFTACSLTGAEVRVGHHRMKRTDCFLPGAMRVVCVPCPRHCVGAGRADSPFSFYADEFFSQGCAPGSLKNSSLCELCIGPNKCVPNNREGYYGYTGAFR